VDTRIAIVAGEHCPILPDGRLREAVDLAEFSAPIPHSPLLHSWKMTAEEMEAGEIVLAAVAPFMVGVFTKRSAAQQYWTFATGTPIAFRGEKPLLTAAHVVSERPGDQPTDMVFLPPPRGGFILSSSLADGKYPRSQRWETSQLIGDHQTDVAAICFQNPPPITFFHMPDEAAVPLRPGRPVAICGYPKATGKAVQMGSIVTDLALADFQAATVVDASGFGLQPFQFAIDYPILPGLVLPGGYSGSMVWYDKAGCTTVGELRQGPQLRIGGIVTDHDPAHDALLCSDENAIIRFLRQIAS